MDMSTLADFVEFSVPESHDFHPEMHEMDSTFRCFDVEKLT